MRVGHFILLALLPLLGRAELTLTSQEQMFLKEHPVIRTQCSYGSPAFEQVKDSRPTGYIIEYLRLLARIAEFEIDFGDSLHVWKDTEQAFHDREIDFLTGTVEVDRYGDYALFSEPYLYFHRVYVVRKDAPDVRSPGDLIGQTVSAINSLPFVDVWKVKYPGIHFLMVDSDEEALRAVADGRADATFTMKSTCDYFAARNGFANLRIGGAEKKAEGLENCFRVAIRSDWPELQSIINKAMAAVPQTERQALWDEWFRHDEFNYDFFFKTLGGASAVLLLVLVRYRMVTRYNKQLRKLNNELEQSLGERDRIMSVISHDLRQPVHGYNQMLALLQSGEINPADEDGQRILTQSRQRGELAIESMENLLNWLNVHRGVRHPVLLSPCRLIEDSRELLAASLENKQLRLENRIDPALRIQADEQRLASVLRNLINNAIKFSPPGSTIEADAASVQTGLQLSIRDYGTGMDAETRRKILEGKIIESSRGTNGEKGSGMGLSLCRQFLGEVGTDLCIESAPGQGSTFSFTVPDQMPRTNC